MNDTKRYEVTCLRCKRTNLAVITKVRENDYSIDLNIGHRKNPDNIAIISGRYRADMDFGWECSCGNDSRIARSEIKDVQELVVNGGKSAIQKIIKGLAITDDKKFRAVEV